TPFPRPTRTASSDPSYPPYLPSRCPLAMVDTINTLYDASEQRGRTLTVHSPQLLNAIDIWTFQKRADVTGRNWILVAVDAEDQEPAD
ncbi:MAG: hypothetical protein ABJN75_09705, partial [Hoeflea sp.]|uniref:hypothetical protein n=1 Tax=Hoeflea sp. TaxID=1940281 RepID=UPI0032970713